jgi:hypothetical protein
MAFRDPHEKVPAVIHPERVLVGRARLFSGPLTKMAKANCFLGRSGEPMLLSYMKNQTHEERAASVLAGPEISCDEDSLIGKDALL